MHPLTHLDLRSFLASTTAPAQESKGMLPVLEVLAHHAETTMAGAQIRTAYGEASNAISQDGCGGWIVAELGEPAVIALRHDLRPGEATWHATRLLVRLGGSPLTLEPGNIGIIGSANVPPLRWADPAEAATDELAYNMLRSMGISKRKAGKYARP